MPLARGRPGPGGLGHLSDVRAQAQWANVDTEPVTTEPWINRAAKVGAIVALALFAAGCVDSTPDTPANAVMDYLTAAQVGKPSANSLLCKRLREAPTDQETATLDRLVNHASIFGTDVVRRDGDAVAVQLQVVMAPSPRGAEGDLWDATMVKEDGHWKVCGFQPEA